MSWLQTDKQLQEDGWRLLLQRHTNGEWACYYMHCHHLPASHRAKTFEEAVSVAQGKILTAHYEGVNNTEAR